MERSSAKCRFLHLIHFQAYARAHCRLPGNALWISFLQPALPPIPRLPGTVLGASHASSHVNQQPYEVGIHLFKVEETKPTEIKQLPQCPQLGFQPTVLSRSEVTER